MIELMRMMAAVTALMVKWLLLRKPRKLEIEEKACEDFKSDDIAAKRARKNMNAEEGNGLVESGHSQGKRSN